MPLFWFLMVVLSLGCGSVPGHEVDASRAWIATAGLVLAWGVLAKLAALVTTKQLDESPADAVAIVKMFERQIGFLRWTSVAVAAMCLVGFGLAGVIESLPICHHSMAARGLLMLCPGAAAVMLVWWGDHQFGVANHLIDGGWRTTLREGLTTFRLQGAWLVVPVLLLLGLIDAILLIPGVPLAASGMIVAGVAVLAVPIGMPWLAQRIWETEPIDQFPQAWLQTIAMATGFKNLSIRRWNTGFKSSNALVAGFLPRCRVMLLTDRLLDRLPNEQLAMIALHELAHLRRHHVPLRMLAILPAWAAAWGTQHFFGQFAWAETIGITTAIIASLGMLCFVSHRTELDADATACRMAVQAARSVAGVPADLPAAAMAMARALDAVTCDSPQARRGTWLHPSVAKRRQKLMQLAGIESPPNGLQTVNPSLTTNPSLRNRTPEPVRADRLTCC